MLDRPELRQLAQRIVARYHLGPLSRSEVAAYVQHRLGVSGVQRQLFPSTLMGHLYRLSGGIPRVINVLCDRALLGTFTQGKDKVDRATLSQAAREVLHQAPQYALARPLLVGGLLVGGLLVAGAALVWMLLTTRAEPPASAGAPIAPTASLPATPQKPPTVKLGTLDWPAGEALERSKELAYNGLFLAWGSSYDGGDPCRQATRLGLSCRSGRGGLDALRQLNRPVVMQMGDDQGREFFATMTALDDKAATYVVGNDTRVVAHADLAAHWSGRYTALLRLPPDGQEQVRVGQSGPAVGWLNRQLALAQGREPPAGNQEQVFDEALVRQVKQFQLEQGLIPDGAAGPQTLMRLSNADPSGPKLLRGAGGK